MRKYSNISVKVPGNMLDLFLARISDLAASSWRRDTAAEEASGELVKFMGVSYVYYVRSDGPQTDIVFLYKDGELSLNNIFTTGNGISHAEHNRVSTEFWKAGMQQACKEMGLAGKHTPTRDVKPEEGLPEPVAKALKYFSVSANKDTGTAHLDDMESFCRFLALLHVSGAKFDESRLEAFLKENKFKEKIVNGLLVQYDLAVTLLPIYDSLRKGKAASTIQ